ncbi:bacterial low temperature requirement A protein-domain-containing protein [Hypoxylon sp. FL1284]|nr:bacterial low temperature requirement A protein-domain-containing protein [Hypoxylon sp. FL1284]
MVHPDLDYTGERLQWVGSRVVEPSEGGSGHRVMPTRHHHHHHQRKDFDLDKEQSHDAPEFSKNEAATNFELFYDLWFVANLNVFTGIHDVSDLAQFNSFIGFMVLLWTTWLLTTLYDVRFTADSVWERVCKAMHLGVMIGFAEIGTHFDPNNQIPSVFQTMSLFLAVSRFVLAVQYGMVLFQIRKYAHGKRPMLVTALLHLCAAAIYLGISFRFDLGRTSRVFLVWYIGGLVEMALHLSISQLSHVLTFLGTHLGERMNLLTLVILGEGCIILAKSITLVVKDTFVKDANYTMWSPTIIGLVTASTALIYIVFQLYFDWMHDEHSMSKRYQVWWTSLHLPFHIALILLLEGANQCIVWARVSESATAALQKVISAVTKVLNNDPTSQQVSDSLKNQIDPFLKEYPPADVLDTSESVNNLLAHIANFPDSVWAHPESDTQEHFNSDVTELLNTMISAVYNAFDIAPPEDANPTKAEHWQSEIVNGIVRRFLLIYVYLFACAGIVLLMMTIMHVISKRKGWSPFNIFRTVVCIAIAIVLALLTIIASNQDAFFRQESYTTFIGSPWMLPTITLCYFFVLVLTHLPHPSASWCTGHLREGRRRRGYKEVEEQRDAREAHLLGEMARQNPRVDDFEDRRTGYASDGHGMRSPPLAGYDAYRPARASSEAGRQRRSRDRRRSSSLRDRIQYGDP